MSVVNHAFTIRLDVTPEMLADSQAKLEKLYRNIESVKKRVVDPAVRRGLQRMAQLAQTYAPKRTGFMANQIRAVENAIVGGAYYTVFVELGHYTRGRKSFVQPQFFMRRAWEETVPEIFSEIDLNIMGLLRESE